MCASVWTALRQDRLLFAFQPVVCAATGRVDYFECLLRMRNIDGRIVAGGEFISTLEQLGRISFIDNYVFEQTVRELVNYPGIRLGLNISSLTAREGAWLQLLISRLRHRSDLARRLVVEITETAALDDIEAAARFVDALHNIGCRVAVDDFGAGHTSLRYLQHLAVDMVKIDRSYVRNLSTNSEQQIFLRAWSISLNALASLPSPKASKVPTMRPLCAQRVLAICKVTILGLRQRNALGSE
jgi:EAL domain-containing protein (putative c-di-GMP-specific phosphodiesterase class I)